MSKKTLFGGIFLSFWFVFFSVVQAEYKSGEVLVQMKSPLSEFSSEGLRSQTSEFYPKIGTLSLKKVESIQDFSSSKKNIKTFSKVESPQYIYLVTYAEDVSVDSAIELLSADPEVIYAQPNFIYRPSLLPNDPKIIIPIDPSAVTTYQYAPHLVNLPEAWDVETGSDQVVVAVIDSGCDITHEDIAANLWVNPTEIADNDIDDDDNGLVDDVNGFDFQQNTAILTDRFFDPTLSRFLNHGTHVSGIISGVGQNNIGIAGASFGGKLMILKAIDDSSGAFFTSKLIAAVNYAKQNGAQVINMSLGGPTNGTDIFLTSAIQSAISTGIFVVAAAGNESVNMDTFHYLPGTIPGVIAVSASDSTGTFDSDYSNFGSSVAIMAPGTDVLSSTPGSMYEVKSGTSMAAPMVSGVIALMRSLVPSASMAEIQTALFSSATDVGDAGEDVLSGAGLVNAFAALQLLDNVSPVITHTRVVTGNALIPLSIVATITDALSVGGVPSASVIYKEYISDTAVGDWITLPMVRSGSTYSADLSLSRVDITDVVYFIKAQDVINITYFPTGGSSDPLNIVFNDVSAPVITSSLQSLDQVSYQSPLVFSLTDNGLVVTASIRIRVTDASSAQVVYQVGDPGVVFANHVLTITPSLTTFILPDGQFELAVTAGDLVGLSSALSLTLSTTQTLFLYGPQGAASPILSKPNPFDPNQGVAKICYQVSRDCQTEILIYSLDLKEVHRQYISDAAGYHEVSWDGKDTFGQMVPRGMYIALVKVTAGDTKIVKKVKIAVLK